MSGSIPASVYGQRLGAAGDALRDAGAAALLIGVGADLRWLTGYAAMPLERLTMLVLPADAPPTLLVPRLELPASLAAPAIASSVVPVQSWDETEDPIARVVTATGVHATGEGREILVSDRLWATFLLSLQEALPRARFGLASRAMRGLRMVKQREEIELLRRAAHAADRTVDAVAGGRLVGRTEADVAREVGTRLVDEGHEHAAFWIVASGRNSASPHHEPKDRVIQAGEPIVLDVGGTIEGYGSDTTRTLWVTGSDGSRPPEPEFLQLYATLEAAQASGVESVRPGATCESIDAVCRDPITAAGYGEQFIHRTGHGIGLEGHEDPYLVAGNAEPLAVGHAFSVEPGIYLEGRYGARIEDIVVCGATGPDPLNVASHELRVVTG